ncbi:MAG TPA: hypothetical protein VFZ11_14565 [Gemmatimonadaceae bacterium]
MRSLSPRLRSRLAGAALAVAALAAALALARAVRLDPPPSGTPRPAEGRYAWVEEAPGAVAPAADAAEELDNDPFDPERRSPFAVDEDGAPIESRPSVEGPVRLLGVVVLPDGRGFAIYQLPSERPRTVHVGESIGGLLLVAVRPGRAVFRAPDGERVELNLSTPGT